MHTEDLLLLSVICSAGPRREWFLPYCMLAVPIKILNKGQDRSTCHLLYEFFIIELLISLMGVARKPSETTISRLPKYKRRWTVRKELLSSKIIGDALHEELAYYY
jgi:hypothetical protein